MKKMFALAFAAVSLAACGNSENDSTADTTTDTSMDAAATTPATTESNMTTDTSMMDTNTTNTTSTSNNSAYAPAEGDVTYRGEKVRVYRSGQWEESKEDVKLDNDVTVRSNGRVTRNGEEVELEEGQVVTKTGRFFDRAGNSIENAWDKTKSGAKKAGKAVGRTVEKAGDKIEQAVTNEKNN